MKLQKRNLIVFFILIVLMSSFRIDYRFKTTVECCSDDYDYFLHASTIAMDFDLNYENQEPRPYSYINNDKKTPIGFIGSGILSAPFLYIGNSISNLLNENTNETIMNFKLLLYSISPIIYFFFTFLILFKLLSIFKINTNKFVVLYFLSSSGITYYAFERFSMTHSYEVFSLSLLMLISARLYTSDKSIYYFLLPVSVLINFLTRMSNFYVFFIPIIIKLLLNKKNINIKKKIINDSKLIISSCLSLLIYYLISIELYGKFLINPQTIYGSNVSIVESVVKQGLFFEDLFSLIKTFFIVMFSFEFGLFWTSPILFAAIIYLLLNFKKIENILILLCFGQNFFIIHIWQSAGSSYGFRYLYSLIPLSVLIIFLYKDKFKLLYYYLLAFSSLGILSVLFFETTELTQLATEAQTNSFGKSIRYVEPDYVVGLFNSFLELNSYLIIFTTSLLGATFFKLILSIIEIENLNIILANLGLPVENNDFQNYILNINQISISKILIIVLMFLYVSYYFVYKISDNTYK